MHCNITVVLRVREVFPGNGRLLGIQVDNSYISLPGELFEKSGNCICMLSNDVALPFQHCTLVNALAGTLLVSE